jgi:hypothetical protein
MSLSRSIGQYFLNNFSVLDESVRPRLAVGCKCTPTRETKKYARGWISR